MNTNTITTTTATAVDALVGFAGHIRTLADAGHVEHSNGNRAAAEALLDAIEAETAALADALRAALGITVDGFGGVGDLVHNLVVELVPPVATLADAIDQHASEATLAAIIGAVGDDDGE